MDALSTTELFDLYFDELVDPRIHNHNSLHLMSDIILLTIMGIMSGADGWTDIKRFGEENISWLSQILELPNGIPSHDTLGRFYHALDSELLEKSFQKWTKALSQIIKEDVLSIDGKSVRSSRKKDGKAFHMISAWSRENGLCFGQLSVPDKTNEITAVPELLDMLNIKNCIVTLDAMGTQKKIAHKIQEKKGHYVLTVKKNQGELYGKVSHLLESLQLASMPEKFVKTYDSLDNDHGRVERRSITVISAMYALELKDKWQGIKSLIKVDYVNETNPEKIKTDTRYFISSLEKDAEAFAHIIRSHWHVENKLHWCLDVVFNEDRSRVRTGFGQANLAILRRLCLNLFKIDKNTNDSLRGKRKRASWNPQYLLNVLQLVNS